MLSTLAGMARWRFSATSAAAVTCGIMKPEFRPGRGVRKAGRPDSAGSTSMAIRRSASEPISQIAMAIMSAAKATGSAWKLPPETTSPVSANTSGLSLTPFASTASVAAACRSRSRQAPITCGWQRRQYGSCTRGSSGPRCEARMALPSINARSAAAASICPRWPRTAWMRGSNGPSLPFAASVASAPVTSAVCKARSASNSPASASAVLTWVPLSSASPSLGPSSSGASPCRASAADASPLAEERAHPHQRRRHVRERREVARGADRALRRDDGQQAARQAGFQHLDHRPAHARSALRQAAELQRQHQPHHLGRQRARPRPPRGSARCCAGAWRGRPPRSAPARASRSRC